MHSKKWMKQLQMLLKNNLLWLSFLATLFTGCSASKSTKVAEQPVAVLRSTPVLSYNESQTYPNWFLNPPSELHGVGIVPYNSRNEIQCFEDAFILAVQDLNSNHFACVTIENFLTGGIYRKSEEVAISETYNFGNVVKIDSVVNNGYVFMLVSTKSLEIQTQEDVNPHSSFRLNEGNAEFVTTKTSLQSKGMGKPSRLELYTAWALSKRASLRILANSTDISIRSVDKKTVDEYNKTTYMKSRVSLRNIRVIKRWIEDEEFCTALEVDLSNLSSLCIN